MTKSSLFLGILLAGAALGGAPALAGKPPAIPSLKPTIDAEDIVGLKAALDAGADANEKWSGATALCWAAWRGSSDMLRLLVDHGAEVDGTGLLGNTALACVIGDRDEPAELIDVNQKVNDRLLKHYTEEQIRAKGWWRQTDPAAFSTTADRVQTLLDLGADPNYLLGNGTVKEWTPFLTAVDKGEVDLVKEMLASKRADPEIRFHQWAEGVDSFVKYIDVGSYTAEGRHVARDWSQVPQFATPLLFAVDKQDVEMVKALVDGGANVNNGRKRELGDSSSTSWWLESPLDVAIKKGNPEIIAILKAKDAVQSEP